MRSVNRLAHCTARPGLEAELASVGVHPAACGKGLGKTLVLAFAEQARARRAEYVYLTTDAVNNDKVNGFYRGLGFAHCRSFLAPGNRLMNEYVLPLKTS
jgi:ribosomal protein S18 acetylase RimI-like enzyme